MYEVPSDISAVQFRDEGSAFYRRKMFFEALVCYNKSLCFSESIQMKSLAFANRSAVYLESKKYQHCLDNIQLAREHGYPEDKSSRLEAREMKCKKLMDQYRPDPREDPWNFFKLSYPANKTLPFIVECLELREDPKYGRHIVTNRDLKPGDIIAIDEPYFKHLDMTHCYERCRNCLKANMLSLSPCEGQCVNTMFCSDECVDSAAPRHRQYECTKRINESTIVIQKLLVDSMNIAGGLEELQACIEEHEETSLTIFDIDMTNPDNRQVKKKQQLMAFLALMAKPGELEGHNRLILEAMAHVVWRDLWKTPEQFEHLLQTAHRLGRINERNAYTFSSWMLSNWTDEEFGAMVSLFGALINHSCDPNVCWFCVDEKHVAVVQFPIKADDQLFICYRKPFFSLSGEERRARLLHDFHFNCECIACRNDFTLSHTKRAFDENFLPPSLLSLSSDPIKDFRKNCKYIEKNFKNHPCRESFLAIINNFCLIQQISKLGSFQKGKVSSKPPVARVLFKT